MNHPLFVVQESTGLSSAVSKKQGVSGQSVAVRSDVNIKRHNKDFRSRTIIKEAIMENDFLKNLSHGQVCDCNTENCTTIVEQTADIVLC